VPFADDVYFVTSDAAMAYGPEIRSACFING
jgi:hypothetical protein